METSPDRTRLRPVITALLTLVLGLASSTVALSPADAATVMTARPASRQLVSGQHTVVTGATGTAVRRTVLLQLWAGAWKSVGKVTTTRRGAFTLKDPLSRIGKYRVSAPPTRVSGRRYAARSASVGAIAWKPVPTTPASPQPTPPASPDPAPPAPPAPRHTVLGSDEVLRAGEQIVSPGGAYRLVMQGDGNLVQYDGSRALWSSATNPTAAGGRAVMQGDGNLVIRRADGSAAWGSGTDTFTGADLALQDDGNLVIYGNGRALWSRFSGRIFNQLRPGESLGIDQSVISLDHRFRLVMQGDGNLVYYQGGTPLWSSNTAGNPGATAVMQNDGNLVVYKPGGVAVWASGTGGRAGSVLVLQDDSNLVIYQSGTAIWSRHSGAGSTGGTSGGGVIGDDYPAYLKGPALDAVVDPWKFYNRECTSFVAWRLNSRNGAAFSNYMRSGHFGNASNWVANARAIGFPVNSTPAVGAVAASGGHVAWVASVGAGTVTIEEYNYNFQGLYRSRTVPTSTFQYIHVKDLT